MKKRHPGAFRNHIYIYFQCKDQVQEPKKSWRKERASVQLESRVGVGLVVVVMVFVLRMPEG